MSEKGWWVGFYRLRWTHPYGLVLVGADGDQASVPISFEAFEAHAEALRAATVAQAQSTLIKRLMDQNVGWKVLGAKLEMRLKWVEIQLMLSLKKSEVVVRERESGRDITGRFRQLMGGVDALWEDGLGMQEADVLYGKLQAYRGVVFRSGERGFNVPVCPGVWEYFGPAGR